VQALPRMLGSATLEDVKKRLLPKFVALSGDEMYRVRKASGECLVDVSRALGVLACVVLGIAVAVINMDVGVGVAVDMTVGMALGAVSTAGGGRHCFFLVSN